MTQFNDLEVYNRVKELAEVRLADGSYFIQPAVCFIKRSLINKYPSDSDIIKIKTIEIVCEFFLEIAKNTEKAINLQSFYKSNKKIEILYSTLLNDIGITEKINEVFKPKPEQFSSTEISECPFCELTNNLLSNALFISVHNIKSYLEVNSFGDRVYFRFLYCLLMQALLSRKISDKLYLIDPKESIIGRSGINRKFDGMLKFADGSNSKKYVIMKLINIFSSDISIISNNGLSMYDISEEMSDVLGQKTDSIIFIPGFQSKDSLEHILFWQNTFHLNMNVLYLSDFFELFRLWNKEKIIRYLLEKIK